MAFTKGGGFTPQNHPQQVGKRGAIDKVDDRETPDWLFELFNAEHGFTLDAAASASNAKCERFFTLADDGLSQSWAGQRVWCNPPFSNLGAWVKKAKAETLDLAEVVVMLLPGNRTEQVWWQEEIEPLRDRPGSGIETRFLARRINFASPDNPTGKFKSSPPFGLVMVRFTRPRPAMPIST